MTQTERLLAYFEEHQTITAVEALTELGIMRLASRVNDLKRQGHRISRKMISVRNRWNEKCNVAEYTYEQ